MTIAAPITRAALSKVATHNKLLLELREHKKLMKQIVKLLLEQNGDQSQTLDEFCQSEKISRSFYYVLEEQNRAPDTMDLANGARRISPEARQRWRREREAETASKKIARAAINK
jgi:hypothetical protein